MVVQAFQKFIFNPDYEKSILMQNSFLVCGILLAYIGFVQFMGPSLMKKRKALDLYYFVILYNIVLVIINAYLSFSIARIAKNFWKNRCHLEKNQHFTEHLKMVGYIGWQVLLVKITELLDTVIFILRKKFNQASFFHIFHHSSITLLLWAILKTNKLAYYVLLTGAVNCGVHALTYAYYGLSAIGPGVQKHLWWKRYLTWIQILQFIVLLFYSGYSFLTGCDEFAMLQKISFCLCSFILGLLLNFYFKAYLKRNEDEKRNK